MTATTINWRHLCIDMQRMFAEDIPWHVEWMEGVLPQVVEMSGRYSEQTIFTRFVPPKCPEDASGAWQQYYRKWWMMTQEHLPPSMIDLVPALKRFIPPARLFDKATYSPWTDGRLNRELNAEHVEAVVLTGGETDVCVLAAAMGAIDLGYHVVVLSDAVCSGADETHVAAMKLLGDRFSIQLEVRSTKDFLSEHG